MAKNSNLSKAWRWTKKIFLFLFIAQLLYIVILKWVNPPITITQLVSWVGGHGLKRDYVSKRNINPNAMLAVIASEDQLFPDHNGFDWKSMKKAMEYNDSQKKKKRGGSTISQQVAKNVFLWQGRSWFRKGLEAYFTFMIELVWGKKRILEVYLNVIEMGEGIFGIEMAASEYFNKKASSLTRLEAAYIAACLPNPKKYKVKSPTSFMRRRASRIVTQMNNISTNPRIRELISTVKK